MGTRNVLRRTRGTFLEESGIALGTMGRIVHRTIERIVLRTIQKREFRNTFVKNGAGAIVLRTIGRIVLRTSPAIVLNAPLRDMFRPLGGDHGLHLRSAKL